MNAGGRLRAQTSRNFYWGEACRCAAPDLLRASTNRPIGRTPRSGPATYASVMTAIRGLIARNSSEVQVSMGVRPH